MNPCKTQSTHRLWLLEKSPEEGFLRFNDNVRLQKPEFPQFWHGYHYSCPKDRLGGRRPSKRLPWNNAGQLLQHCELITSALLASKFFLVNKSSYCISEMHPIILRVIDWKVLHLLERLLNNIVSTYKALSLKSLSGQHHVKIVILKLWTSFWQIGTNKS